MQIGLQGWVLLLLLGIANPALLLAAPPTNDSFATPTILTGFPVTASGSNVSATLEPDEPIPATHYGASVWFRWTAPISGPVQIDTLGSDFDTGLAVGTNTPLSNLSWILENNSFFGAQSAVFFDAVSGTTYQIAVYGYFSFPGTILLHITNDVLARISGTVDGPDGSMPLEGITTVAYRWKEVYGGGLWDPVSSTRTDANGEYTLRGLYGGTHMVSFSDEDGDYLTEIYDDAADFDVGNAVFVLSETITTGINASLAAASMISGHVTDPYGIMPLENVLVTARQTSASEGDPRSATTDSTGYYIFKGLAAGTYRIEFHDLNNNHLTEVYNNATDFDSGTDIVVPAATFIPNIDASLADASEISGTITGSDGTTPLPGILATAYRRRLPVYWDTVQTDVTDAYGNYTIKGLAPDTYRVGFSDPTGSYYDEVYDDATDLEVGMNVVVPIETTVTAIDASLATASIISGTVTGPDGVTPLPNIEVRIFNMVVPFYNLVASTNTSADGTYSIGHLAIDTYWVQFWDSSGKYLSEAYDNAPSLDSGTAIVVNSGETVSTINASLGYVNAAHMTGLQMTSTNSFELSLTGTPNRTYFLQEATSLTGEWTDVDSVVIQHPDTHILQRMVSAPTTFWRFRLMP